MSFTFAAGVLSRCASETTPISINANMKTNKMSRCISFAFIVCQTPDKFDTLSLLTPTNAAHPLVTTYCGRVPTTIYPTRILVDSRLQVNNRPRKAGILDGCPLGHTSATVLRMKAIIIQLQPDRSDLCNETDALEAIESIAHDLDPVEEIEMESGDDDGPYTNILITTSDLSSTWKTLKTELFEHEELGPFLSASTIVSAEGDEGWDDYLLLHHYDPSEETDTL